MKPSRFPVFAATLVMVVLFLTACAEWENYVKEHSTYVASTEYVQNPRAPRSNSVAASAPRTADSARFVSPTDSAVASANADETQLVTATGYGMTIDEAKKAAVRAAVESVVGTLVDAETLVENDELVHDKILSYSAGFVEDVKIIGEPTKASSGLLTVRVQVKVRKTELAERVQTTIKTSGKIDGESLYQKVAFNQQNLNEAGAIMEILFRPERMQGLLKFNPDGIDVDEATGEVTVSIKGGVNLEAYKRWTDEIIEKLTPMATKKITGTANLSLHDDGTFYGFRSAGFDIVHGKGLSILRSLRSMEVVGLTFANDKLALLLKQLRRYDNIGAQYTWTLSVSLVDKMGEIIKRSNVALNWDSDDEHVLIISNGSNEIFPAYSLMEGNYNYAIGPFERVSVSLGRLKPQDLCEIDSVTVEVSMRPN